MSTPNWGLLVSQGRAKAHGVPWTESEIKLVTEIASIPGVSREKAADYVRRGCESVEDYEKMVKADSAYADKNGELPLEAMDRQQLQAKLASEDVKVTDQAPDDVLRKLASKKPTKKATKSKKK